MGGAGMSSVRVYLRSGCDTCGELVDTSLLRGEDARKFVAV
jgi:hypothetical protein